MQKNEGAIRPEDMHAAETVLRRVDVSVLCSDFSTGTRSAEGTATLLTPGSECVLPWLLRGSVADLAAAEFDAESVAWVDQRRDLWSRAARLAADGVRGLTGAAVHWRGELGDETVMLCLDAEAGAWLALCVHAGGRAVLPVADEDARFVLDAGSYGEGCEAMSDALELAAMTEKEKEEA